MADSNEDKESLLEGLKAWVSEWKISSKKAKAEKAPSNKDVQLNIKLWNAVQLGGSHDDIQKLLEIGADPTARNQKGYNALQLALMHGCSLETLEMIERYSPKTSPKPRRK